MKIVSNIEMSRVFQIIGLLILFLMVKPCFAVEDFIIKRAYFEDKTNQLKLDEVKVKNFVEYDGFLAKGYVDSAFWLRITIDPQKKLSDISNPNESLVMLIRPSNLDQIQIYDSRNNGSQPYFVGDTVDFNLRENDQYQSLSFSKVIQRGDIPRDIWLRLKTTSANLIDVEVFTLSEAYNFEKKREFLYEFSVAYFLCFLLLSVYFFIFSRERLVFVFAVKQFFGFFSTVFIYGYFRFLFADKVSVLLIDELTSVFVICYGACIVFFDYMFLKEYQSRRRGSLVLFSLLLFFPIALLLVFSGHPMRALQFNMIASTVSPLFVFLSLVLNRRRLNWAENHSILLNKIVMATYALVSVLSLFFIFAVIGVFSTGELFLQGRIFQGFFSGTLLMVVLQIRAYHIEKSRQLAVTQLEIKQREIDVEWQHQEEKSQFLGILAHDLKTPLALIKMILGIKEFSVEHVNHLNNAVNDMNTVIERCLQVSQVEDNKLDLVLEKVDLFGLLMDKKKQSIAAKRINIDCHDSIYLITDDQLLRIILSNLVDNANKYSDPYATIEIKVRRDSQGDKDGVAISIINMPGRFGFPDPEKVFQKYYRANNNTRLSGTGQGLYLVANLAKMLGGNIRYIPDQAYVCFTLWLPNNFNERSQSGVDAG